MKQYQDHYRIPGVAQDANNLKDSNGCGEAEGKPASAAGVKESCAALVITLLCLFLFISAWWILFSPASTQ